MAYYDYTHPDLQPQAWTVTASTIGGFAAGRLGVPLRLHPRARRAGADGAAAPFTFSAPAHPGARTPVALNGFALWVAMMIALTVVNYGFPIAQLASLKDTSVPVIPDREPVMREPGMYSWSNRLVPLERRVARRADGGSRCSSASCGCRRCTPTSRAQGLWDSICRAAGVPTTWSDAAASAKRGRSATACRARAQR